MNDFRVVIEAPAWKQLMTLPQRLQDRLLTAMEQLEQNPYPSGCKKMVNAANTYRIRRGDYRIIYQVEDAQLVVFILKVGHRRDVYRKKS